MEEVTFQQKITLNQYYRRNNTFMNSFRIHHRGNNNSNNSDMVIYGETPFYIPFII